MAVSKKSEIVAEAMGCFKTKEVPIGNKVIQLRELTVTEQRALDEKIFVMGDGDLAREFFVNDKGNRVVREDFKHWDEHWIAATATPTFTVDELIPWPASLKAMLGDEARKINGILPADQTAKNS
jgi:hypothetical protein